MKRVMLAVGIAMCVVLALAPCCCCYQRPCSWAGPGAESRALDIEWRFREGPSIGAAGALDRCSRRGLVQEEKQNHDEKLVIGWGLVIGRRKKSLIRIC